MLAFLSFYTKMEGSWYEKEKVDKEGMKFCALCRMLPEEFTV